STISSGEHLTLLDEHTAQSLSFFEDGRKQRTDSTAHVHYSVHIRPVVSISNLLVLVTAQFGESAVEFLGLLRMLPEIIPDRLSKNMIRGRLASHYSMTESCGRFQEWIGAIEERGISQAARTIAKEIG